MKHLQITLCTLVMLHVTFAQGPVDSIGVKGPIAFSSYTFQLALFEKASNLHYIQEYYPDGANIDSLKNFIRIHLYDSTVDAKQAVIGQVNFLNEVKKTDSICQYTVIDSPDGKEFIIDFTLSEKDKNNISYFEFNVARFKQVATGLNKKGVLIFQYVKRIYSKNPQDLYQFLRREKALYVSEMIETELPNVALKN